MTTVWLPDASTYRTIELVLCLVTPSARAYGSEGWGSNPFARATSQNSKIRDHGFEATFATCRRGLSSAADPLTPPVSQPKFCDNSEDFGGCCDDRPPRVPRRSPHPHRRTPIAPANAACCSPYKTALTENEHARDHYGPRVRHSTSGSVGFDGGVGVNER